MHLNNSVFNSSAHPAGGPGDGSQSLTPVASAPQSARQLAGLEKTKPIHHLNRKVSHPGLSGMYQKAGESAKREKLENGGISKIEQKALSDEPKKRSLKNFYEKLLPSDKLTVIVGAGTAALTYLATKRFDAADTHILLIGGSGYWGDQVAHRLGQPNHIFALPHSKSAEFVDPNEHNRENGILPHHETSAYVHSLEYQKRLMDLEKMALNSLRAQGKKIHIENGVSTQKIHREGSKFKIKLDISEDLFVADKMVVATGAAPGRKFPLELFPKSTDAMISGQAHIGDHILSYSDILTADIAEKIRDKDVFIYGGGATGAWAMEVSEQIGKSSKWVSRIGFDDAEEAGSRVEAIIKGSRDSQLKGNISSIEYLPPSSNSPDQKKIRVNVVEVNRDQSKKTVSFVVDYIVNCIGQDPYEEGGLHATLSPEIKNELSPIMDRHKMSGKSGVNLGFGTPGGELEIIGAAAASYYDIERNLKPGAAISEALPRSARVPTTIGGVVSSVAALTGYMPITQNSISGEIALSGLNMHVMNATQLAVYFSGLHPMARPEEINNAVEQYLLQRSVTEFGLTDLQTQNFMAKHFPS